MQLPRLFIAAAVALAFLPAFANDADTEARHLRRIKQLTFAGSRSGEGYFSPDGRQIVFQSTRPPQKPGEAENPFYQIFTMDLRDGVLRRISPGAGKTTCSFFRPDGKRVLYASTHPDPDALKKQREEIEVLKNAHGRRYQWDFDDAYDIFDCKPDGSDLRRLTNAKSYDAEAGYSPDGKLICFCSNRDGDREIYVMDADGGNPRRVTRDPGYDGGPFFSPDGKWIIYRHFTPDDKQAEITMVRVDGTAKRQVTKLGAMSWAPYFHPGGNWIVFCSNKDGGHANFELYAIKPDGTLLTRLTYTDGFDGLPVFSPDGTRLMWTSTRAGGKSQLFIADWVEPWSFGKSETRNSKSEIKKTFDPARIQKEIAFLASPELQGRKTASPGEKKAAAFIGKNFTASGLKPAEHPFTFQSGLGVGMSNLFEVTLGTEKLASAIDKDYTPLALSANGEVEGEVVFAGYNIVSEGYDSFAGLDVKDKIVLALRFQPESAPEKEKQRLRHFAPLRMKAMLARDRGAKAFLTFTGPSSLPTDQFVGRKGDGSFADSGIVAAQISRSLAVKMFAAAGKDMKAAQDALDKLETQAGFALPGVKVKLRVDLKKETAASRNVWTLVRASATNRVNEVVVVGAHYDHLGLGGDNSLGDGLEAVHPGADDNASGTAGVLELARHFAGRPKSLRRDVLFVCFSGEEIGTLGSSAFVKNPPVPLSNIVAMVNMDMIGRLRDGRLAVQGAGSAAVWPAMVERHAAPLPLGVTLGNDPYLPTDSIVFYQKGIPALNFFTGSHYDYHKPSDTADKINASGEADVLELVRRVVEDLATRPDRPRYEKVTGPAAELGREVLRAYLGTIPDYTETSQPGVKLSGVRGGSPAEKGGLKAGDVIVKFGAKDIRNIYDYTYALEGAKIGQPVEIVVQREGKQVPLKITPEQRK
ncbi:MAG: PD40 domain-containing protein [Verrucomicrobia bacterium]|nr:PD40 domain-containing protein [Verrucomicrobiota bacterium]